MKSKTNDEGSEHVCPVETAIEVIGGKWKCQILHNLMANTMRFSELRRHIPGVSQRVLTRKLRELEKHGVINRKVYAEVPPKTEYSLTQLGRSLKPVLNVLDCWAEEHSAAVTALPQKG